MCTGIGLAAHPCRAQWFAEATSGLGAPQPCKGSGCYSNYVLMADLDGDGDLDIAFANGGGYYQLGNAEPLALYRNDGSGQFTEMNALALGGFIGRLRQIAVGDVDGDGDLDLLAADSWGKQPDSLFINQSNFVFVDQGPLRLATSSRSAGARFGDLDGDGDLDLALTDWGSKPYGSAGTARVYVNNGQGYFVQLADAVTQGTSAIGTGPIDIDLFDADGDFDLDMLLASRKGDSLFFRNDGTGHFTDANADLPDQPGPYVYGPDVCDVDGDGDLDLWLDNGGPNLQEQLLINDGQGHFADQSLAQITGNSFADDNEVQCADLDNDGDLDAVVASLSGVERTLFNNGVGHFSAVAGTFPAVSDSTLGLDFGDINGDGRLDAVTAQGEGGDFTNRLYLGTAEQPKDTHPPKITRMQVLTLPTQPGKLVVRFAVADRHTTDAGPRLQSAHVLWAPTQGLGTPTQVKARFVGGDLFWAELAPAAGTQVTWTACAIDPQGNQACSSPQVASLPATTTPSLSDAGPGADAVAAEETAAQVTGSQRKGPQQTSSCSAYGGQVKPMAAVQALFVDLVSLVLLVRYRRRLANNS